MSQEAEAREPGELLDPGDRVVAPHRLAEALDFLRRHLEVEAKRRGETDRIESSVREAVASPERLCHRVAEPKPRTGEGGAGVHGTFEEVLPTLLVLPIRQDERKRERDQPCPGERLRVCAGIAALDVESLRAVRQRVQ